MLRRWPWLSALVVLVITAALVILDISDASVQRYWSRHSFTSAVLAGLLVLLLTVLIVDRAIRIRQLRNQSRAIAAQAAVIVAQAAQAADAIARSSPSAAEREEASDELRAYAQMLLVSAPVLIDAKAPRAFLETGQRVAAQLFRALRDADNEGAEHTKAGAADALEQLRGAAAPLLQVLNREQRAAVSSGEVDSRKR